MASAKDHFHIPGPKNLYKSTSIHAVADLHDWSKSLLVSEGHETKDGWNVLLTSEEKQTQKALFILILALLGLQRLGLPPPLQRHQHTIDKSR